MPNLNLPDFVNLPKHWPKLIKLCLATEVAKLLIVLFNRKTLSFCNLNKGDISSSSSTSSFEPPDGLII